MQYLRTGLLSLAVVVLASGCSLMAPKYSPSAENLETLNKSSIGQIKVGTFDSAPGKENANPITLRGNSVASPYDNSYARYLEEALKQELAVVNKLAKDGNVVVSGTLLKNDMDTSSFTTSHGGVSARFMVKRDSNVVYDSVKTAEGEWPSSFVGAIAIPRAIQEYGNLVQKLLGQLYVDPKFLDAVK